MEILFWSYLTALGQLLVPILCLRITFDYLRIFLFKD